MCAAAGKTGHCVPVHACRFQHGEYSQHHQNNMSVMQIESGKCTTSGRIDGSDQAKISTSNQREREFEVKRDIQDSRIK